MENQAQIWLLLLSRFGCKLIDQRVERAAATSAAVNQFSHQAAIEPIELRRAQDAIECHIRKCPLRNRAECEKCKLSSRLRHQAIAANEN
jgi:hypothetical protein